MYMSFISSLFWALQNDALGFPVASVMMDKIVEATKSGTVTVRRPVEDRRDP